jgi:uncharacterized membrane protein
MQCTKCGTEVGECAGFCAKCRSPIGTSGTTSSPQTATGLQSNIAGLLRYLAGFITGIFFLVADPYKQDRFVRFHAFQAIFLSVVWFAVYFVLGVFLTILPSMLWRLGWLLQSGLSFAFFCLWVFRMFKAYNNEQFKLPVIGDLAAKQA